MHVAPSADYNGARVGTVLQCMLRAAYVEVAWSVLCMPRVCCSVASVMLQCCTGECAARLLQLLDVRGADIMTMDPAVCKHILKTEHMTCAGRRLEVMGHSVSESVALELFCCVWAVVFLCVCLCVCLCRCR